MGLTVQNAIILLQEAFPYTWVSSNDNILKYIFNFQSIAELCNEC